VEALSLTYAGMRYADRTDALADGTVKPRNIDLRVESITSVSDLFNKMAQTAAYEVAEMSLSSYVMMRSAGDRRLVGLPIFTSRAFRHSQIYVHADSGIVDPRDLVGKDVGVSQYQMTAALWIRAFLQHDYGVAPQQIRWFTGGLSTPGFAERVPHTPPPGVRLERIPEDRTLEDMLERGEISALIGARQPTAFLLGSARVRRLFPDYRAVELDYYRRTRHFPIMHMVVVRRDVYEAHRWVALALLDAFEEAKRRGYERLRDMDTPAIAHPWIASELTELAAIFGGDPFVYGFRPNEHTLAAVTAFSHEQGLSTAKVDAADLFPSETLDWKPSQSRYGETRAIG
jgi:4,5-dihydroxyphthalate decarboxylase